jgi:hypothetical protein
MNHSLPTIPQQIPAVCKMLRTKNSFANLTENDADATPWQLGESTTAVFWCLKTMQHSGPDEDYAHPHTCLAGRTCYRSPDE